MEYYNNIESTPLSVFRDVIIKGDKHVLFIGNGEYDEEKANEAWLTLYDEYNAAVNSKSLNITFELSKQAHILKNQYSMLNNCLFLIIEATNVNLINDNEEINIDEYIKIINEYGYRFQKSKCIGKEVTRIQKQLSNYKTRIEHILEKIEKDNKKGSSDTFDTTINDVEMFRGIAFDEKTTVKKFTIVLNALIKKG